MLGKWWRKVRVALTVSEDSRFTACPRPLRVYLAIKSGTDGGIRTPNLRFWRPLLYVLSYVRILLQIDDRVRLRPDDHIKHLHLGTGRRRRRGDGVARIALNRPKVAGRDIKPVNARRSVRYCIRCDSAGVGKELKWRGALDRKSVV